MEFVIAIPTVYRAKESYLLDTLDSVFDGIGDNDPNFGIIVFFGGANRSFFEESSTQLTQKYASRDFEILCSTKTY